MSEEIEDDSTPVEGRAAAFRRRREQLIDDTVSSVKRTWSSSKLSSLFAGIQQEREKLAQAAARLNTYLDGITPTIHTKGVVFRDVGVSLAGMDSDEHLVHVAARDETVRTLLVAVLANSKADKAGAVEATYRLYSAQGKSQVSELLTINSASGLSAQRAVEWTLKAGMYITVAFAVAGSDQAQFQGLTTSVSWQ